jgi:hypothetical protein
MSLTLLIKYSTILEDMQCFMEAANTLIQRLLSESGCCPSQKLPLPDNTENTYQRRAEENALRKPHKDGEWRDAEEGGAKFDRSSCAIQAKVVIDLNYSRCVPGSSYHLYAFSSTSLLKDID